MVRFHEKYQAVLEHQMEWILFVEIEGMNYSLYTALMERRQYLNKIDVFMKRSTTELLLAFIPLSADVHKNAIYFLIWQ
jgi:hypothetical protein